MFEKYQKLIKLVSISGMRIRIIEFSKYVSEKQFVI